PREFADTDIATIKNFKVEPLKTLIPIDEPENGRLDFHYPADYVQEKRI
ncbi:transposase, partial [Bacteroides caccae]